MTAIEYGLVAALVGVVIITGLTAAGFGPKELHPVCPAGTAYAGEAKMCIAGAVAPRWQ